MTYSIAPGMKASHRCCRMVSTSRKAKASKTGKISVLFVFHGHFGKLFSYFGIYFLSLFIISLILLPWFEKKHFFSNGLFGTSVLKGSGSKP